MRVDIEIPDLGPLPSYFSHHVVVSFFTPSETLVPYPAYALAMTIVRLVDAAGAEYNEARRLTLKFWQTHDALQIGAVTRGTAYFESCLTNMHRAIAATRSLRGKFGKNSVIQGLLPKAPSFTKGKIAAQVKDIRNAIQHLDNDICNGNILQGRSFALRAHGPITTVAGEPEKELLTIDRLELRNHEILFSDVSTCLKDMTKCAEKIFNRKLRPQ